MSSISLDTNAFRTIVENTSLREKIETSKEVFVSSVVLGELYYGYKGGDRENKNRQWLQHFLELAQISVLVVDEVTAEYYAEIREELRKKGTPIPSNDIWIAAHAMQTGSMLVTDDGHFDEVAGLRVWRGV